ncbi:hypothetical protein BUALT_Bualt12G0086000 [Buddleja alternifolia]|uniref:F-box domain-containing protein n=1 Tax=Buddleja alternifolia TaxID=168488 RepID=A0AAV6WRB1_9LAMI|nr:hypothetical protein BUALT_Bualt12G0086000 [Buddleja alternifolia]
MKNEKFPMFAEFYASPTLSSVPDPNFITAFAYKMSDIPSELFHNILCRVPSAESLFLWRGVCKSWRRIIDDPAFIKSHIKHHQSSSSTSLGQLLVRNENGGRLSSLSLDSINFVDRHQTIVETQVKNLIRRSVPRLTTLPVASCHGLVLLSHDEAKKIWVLWNPLTQEYYDLPECGADLHLEGCGLGYDILNDDYKVVRINRIFLNREIVHRTLIYSLKFNSWKWIKDCPGDLGIHSQGLYLNGALYWLSSNFMSSNFIIVLDLSTEDYHQLPLPSLDTKRMVDRKMNLDVLGGCLVLSCIYSHNYMRERLYGWEMKDDGGNVSWTKLFSFEESDDNFLGCMRKTLRPITYSKSNRRVLLQCDHEFFWLNTDDNCAKKVRIHGLRGSFSGSFSCQVWQASLFRLGDVVGAKRIERVKKRRRAKKRLQLEVTITEASEWSDSGFSCYSSEGEDY